MRFTRATLRSLPLVLLAVHGGSAFAQVGSSRGGCNAATVPGSTEAIIYQDANFQGNCRILTEGVFPTPGDFDLPPASISSIKVGSSMQLHLFFETFFKFFGGDFAYIDCIKRKVGDHPNLGSDPNLCNNRGGGWNDKARSLRLVRKSMLCGGQLGAGQAELYTNANFTGDCVKKNAGSYNYWETGIMEETVSSLRVGSAADLLVCRERDFFKCNSYRAGSNVPQVSARPAENDTISSFSVIQ